MGNRFSRGVKPPPVILLKYTALQEPQVEMVMPAVPIIPPLPLFFPVPVFIDDAIVRTFMWLHASGNQFFNSNSEPTSPCSSRASTLIERTAPPSPVLHQTSWLHRLGKTDKDLATLEAEWAAQMKQNEVESLADKQAQDSNPGYSNFRPMEPYDENYVLRECYHTDKGPFTKEDVEVQRIFRSRIEFDPNVYSPEIIVGLCGPDFYEFETVLQIEELTKRTEIWRKNKDPFYLHRS